MNMDIMNNMNIHIIQYEYLSSIYIDLILPELQQHLFKRCTAFQQCTADELIE